MKGQHIKVLRGKFKVLNTYIIKEKKMPWINDQGLHFKKLEKQIKYKASRRKKIIK